MGKIESLAASETQRCEYSIHSTVDANLPVHLEVRFSITGGLFIKLQLPLETLKGMITHTQTPCVHSDSMQVKR